MSCNHRGVGSNRRGVGCNGRGVGCNRRGVGCNSRGVCSNRRGVGSNRGGIGGGLSFNLQHPLTSVSVNECEGEGRRRGGRFPLHPGKCVIHDSPLGQPP